MNRKRKIIILIIMAIALLISYSSLHMGKGELCKGVFWSDDTPIPGATVALDIDGDGFIDITETVDAYGFICFPGLTYGTCYIYVDIDNDGFWDTEAEAVVIDQECVIIQNIYDLPPEMWRL